MASPKGVASGFGKNIPNLVWKGYVFLIAFPRGWMPRRPPGANPWGYGTVAIPTTLSQIRPSWALGPVNGAIRQNRRRGNTSFSEHRGLLSRARGRSLGRSVQHYRGMTVPERDPRDILRHFRTRRARVSQHSRGSHAEQYAFRDTRPHFFDSVGKLGN